MSQREAFFKKKKVKPMQCGILPACLSFGCVQLSAAFGAVRQTWSTSLCWCSWRCLTRLCKGQVRLLIRVPHSVFKSQHSGARIAHKSFKTLTMWIISCTKVTGHVTSWNARATVFIVIVFTTRYRIPRHKILGEVKRKNICDEEFFILSEGS